jgi:hypothetical protein
MKPRMTPMGTDQKMRPNLFLCATPEEEQKACHENKPQGETRD